MSENEFLIICWASFDRELHTNFAEIIANMSDNKIALEEAVHEVYKALKNEWIEIRNNDVKLTKTGWKLFQDNIKKYNRLSHLWWLNKLYNQNCISKNTKELAIKLLPENFPIPRGCTGPDEKLFYEWEKDEHFLEVEIIENTAEIFYLNKKTEESWLEENVSNFTKEILEKIKWIY